MLYETYQAQSDVMTPIRMIARAARDLLNEPQSFFPWPFFVHSPLLASHPMVRSAAAACEMVARAGMWHDRPDFRIKTTVAQGTTVSVREVPAIEHPFCTLTHFKKEASLLAPKVLLVAPLSGHFATLLRGTVEALLPDHDVYLTDWVNARNVPALHGRFDLDDYIDLVMSFIRRLGPSTHVIAVCQPAVPVMAAVSLLAAETPEAQPSSMVLMGGPIDTRVNPTSVNRLATSRSLGWFERSVIGTVPPRYKGAFRRVYPGFMQLAGFMTMNLDRHITAHVDLFKHLVEGDGESAEATKSFYDEYMSVMDLPADFYLQTIERVFQVQALARGTFVSRGRRVDPGAITRTALLTVEGENDDICAVGQTSAALALCHGLPSNAMTSYVQPGVGHYGVFNGRRWRTEIYPRVRDFIRSHDQ